MRMSALHIALRAGIRLGSPLRSDFCVTVQNGVPSVVSRIGRADLAIGTLDKRRRIRQPAVVRRGRFRVSVTIALGLVCLAVGCASDEQPTAATSTATQSSDDDVQLYMSYVTNCEWTWVLAYADRSWRSVEPPQWDENAARTGVVLSFSENELFYRDDDDGTEVRFVPNTQTDTICS